MQRFLSLIIILAGLLMASCKEKYVASVTELQLASVSPVQGYSGGIITIYGRNFSNEFGENRVFLGDVEARVLEYNSWDLTVVLPDQAIGTYDITVQTPKGKVTGLTFNYIERPEHEYLVSTIAGSGKAGTKDGNGVSAQFQQPEGVVMDKNGNLWVSQRGGTTSVRMIDPNYNVTTVAKIELPWHGSFGPDGNYYFAAKAKNKIFKVNVTDNSVSEVSFSGNCTLNQLMDVKFDKDGAMWICSRNPVSEVIKVVNGSVQKTYKDIPWPSCITFDKQGRVIVGTEVDRSVAPDKVNGLYMIGTDDSVTRIAGTGDLKTSDGSVSDGNKGEPLTSVVGHVGGVFAAKDGTVYFCDKSNNAVRKLVPALDGAWTNGTISTIVKGFYPSDLYVTDDCTRIYVTSATSHSVKLIEIF